MKSNWRLTRLSWFARTVVLCSAAVAGCSPQPVVVSPKAPPADTAVPPETTPPPLAPPAATESTDVDRGQRKVDVQVGGPGGVNVQVGPKSGNPNEPSNR